ncbi:MAG: hypothetical protein B6I28_00935 [Fusobacteriia bacterium 4572_132]|nr:MAG: hypothetical protein B6I28_00935 [Fusobacteriia bacterium 4572_132]
MKYYKKTLDLLWKKKVLVIMSLIVSLINTPLKSNVITGLGGYFLALYITIGFLGMIKENKIGFKSLFKNGNINFSSVFLTLFETFIIYIIDVLVVLFFSILPIIIMGVEISKEMSVYTILVLMIVVGIYRLPLFLLSFLIPINDKKEYGKYGIIKAKEIIWDNKKLWILVLPQALIYVILFIIKFQLTSTMIYNVIEILNSMLFLFFIITDYIFVKEIIKKNEKYNVRYDEENFNEKYIGLQGKIIL